MSSPAAVDPQQAALLGELVRILADEAASVERALDLVLDGLGSAADLEFAAVCTLEQAHEPLAVTAMVGDHPVPATDLALATTLYWEPRTVVELPNRMFVPLRRAGETTGVLIIAGSRLEKVWPDFILLLAVHLAGTLRALAAERDRRFTAHSARATRRLFEEGSAADSIEAAGEVLARVTAEAFRTQRAGLLLVDPEGRIRHVVGVGMTRQLSQGLAESLIGLNATESPIWRSTEIAGGPTLVDDTDRSPARPGGFVDSMALRSYAAIPLLSAAGPVGMVLCGDVDRCRTWSARDRELARQLAMEGALIVDSARLRQAERAHLTELTHQAYHDALTGLPNRSRLLDVMHRALGGRHRAALLLVDLDGFKQVNDTLGHHAGDALLQRVAGRLADAVRDGDLAARLGGDEFAVLMCGEPDGVTVEALAERVYRQLSEPYHIEDSTVRVGASVGMALYPDHAADVTALLRSADSAMYHAKRDRSGPLMFTGR